MDDSLIVSSFDQIDLPSEGVHLALGMFDGVHIGHQAVLESAIHGARHRGGIAAALTFWTHPSRVLNPSAPKKMILPLELKIRLLKSFGMQEVVVRRFDRDLAAIPAEGFVKLLKRVIPSLKGIYVGENFCFGRGREGNVDDLVELGKKEDISVVSASSLRCNGVNVSSTRIRKQLENADIATANSFLGYAYFIEGTVVDGDKRGRTIGFPTLNIPWEAELKLKYGVYAVTLKSEGAEILLPGVANFGTRPTVDGVGAPLLEVHLFDPTALGPGARVQVQFYEFIRAEQKYESLDALKYKIAKDTELAKKILTDNPPISCII